MSDNLTHYGMPRRSGRYPWGSGDDPQRNHDFAARVKELRKQGLSQIEVATAMGMNTQELRAKITISNAAIKKAEYTEASKLKEKGMSNVAIGKQMGKAEGYIRYLLDPQKQERLSVTENIANTLKKEVDQKELLDVGIGIERNMNISRTKLKAAFYLLNEEGYQLHDIKVKQIGTGKSTSMLVLSKPDVEYSYVYANRDKIKMFTSYSDDNGRSIFGLEPVRSIDSKKVYIRYGDVGGKNMDGVIQLRRGVPELSLGDKRYAQVRIAVDGTHYMKGMAIYHDDMPDGTDIIYNTNKKSGTPKEDVFKKMERTKEGEIDQENPFGSSVRQKHFKDKKGKDQLSILNTVGFKEGSGEEGAWEKWSRTLSSQMLSKQPKTLVEKQLSLAFNAKKEEYNEINSLTNSVIRKKLLNSFSDQCDSDAVHLKGAAMPRQMSHIILPLEKIKETEVYAPNYKNGEKVVLIRHPHGGIFEIPELVVNNNNPAGRNLFGGARDIRDAIGIHPKVAEQLSGADFDGDTVLVIPNPARGGIKTSAPLKQLKNFDPKEIYKYREGMKVMGTKGGGQTGQKMGDISNLITDMSIKGAPEEHIARAVRHSMVVIDAEKHKLDYAQSYIDHGIASLKQKYQGGANRGASTLISRASSEERVTYRVEGKHVGLNPKTGRPRRVYIDPVTGQKLYEYKPQVYVNQKGKTIERKIKSTKMYETPNALTLSSGTEVENIYALHANKLKALANQARKDYLNVDKFVYAPEANKKYAPEVASLKASLNVALKNAPLERHAQLISESIVRAKKLSNPDMDKSEIKKIGQQALASQRASHQAGKRYINISEREWEAIQSHAITANTLTDIINNTKPELIKRLATPRTSLTLTPAKLAQAKALLDNNNTRADVAARFGVSVSTLSKMLQ